MLVETYEKIIADHASVCTIIEDEGNSWTLSKGCPIVSVDHASSQGEIGGVTYEVYETTVDLAYYDDTNVNLLIRSDAFSGLPALETVVFSARYGLFQPWIFKDTPRLVDLVFENNENYEVMDRIVYDEEGETLLYYPSGLDDKDFVIPDHVIEIGHNAFGDNTYLESVTIPLSVKSYRTTAFNSTSALLRIEVANGHDTLLDHDGVLFSTNGTLLRYPNGRDDAEYVVPDGTKVIAPYAFHGQPHVQNVLFPDGLTHVGYNVFSETENIAVLDLPESVEWIDARLTESSSVHSIIIRRSGIEQEGLTLGMLSWYENMPTIYVPDDSLELYEDSLYWYMLAFMIEPYSAFEEEN